MSSEGAREARRAVRRGGPEAPYPAEEELLGSYLAEKDLLRLRKEHEELRRLVSLAKRASGQQCRQDLGSFADLLERHVRWEERELFPYAEDHLDAATLAFGGQIEERLVR